MSDWVADKVLEAVVQEGYYQESNPDAYESLSELAIAREAELKTAGISEATIQNLIEGKQPKDSLDLLKIGMVLGMSSEDMMKLYEKSDFKKRETNGV